MSEDEILKRLDFNSVHSGDPIARVYFEQAARAIRSLQRDVRHFRRLLSIERARRFEADGDAEAIAGVLDRIVTNAQGIAAPAGDETAQQAQP